MMRILISGGSGFIGTHLGEKLKPQSTPFSLRNSGWSQQIAALKPQAIVHLAGQANPGAPEKEIWDINVEGTRKLAEEAITQRVKRFIFLSSIQVVGKKDAASPSIRIDENTVSGRAYGRSKMEAEELLCRFSTAGRLEVVIIRSPLVHGPGVKGNFRSLLRLVDRGVPLPLSSLGLNRRSFVGVSNLTDLILACLEHPAAVNQTFHVSDDDDISTAELIRRMGKALGRPIRNFPIPEVVLKTGLRIIGEGDWVDKLFGDLRVDITETKRILGWKPKVTMEEELERTAKWLRESQQGRL